MDNATDITTRLKPGTPVEISTRLRGNWAAGFAIVAVDGDRYRVRRTSDGTVLPVDFDARRVRAASE